ncbi:MAG: STAS domain-containing protein [Verrucomicrobiota bacterium]|nr:STAS domain-containing protein [Verrucomicrobiota bacterium]
MAAPSAKISVFAGPEFACVRVAGRANFNFGPDLKALLGELGRTEQKRFILDLSDCVLMDSTFLGLLAEFGMKISRDAAGSGRRVELLNPNARLTELLENLGVLGLFKVTTGTLELPPETESRALDSTGPTREDITRTCLQAHQTLMAAHPDNVARFKDVAQFLAENLKKPREKSP